MNGKLKDLNVDEAKILLSDLWLLSSFGVKERFKKYHSHRGLHYILRTPGYSKKQTVINQILTIKKVAEEVKSDVDNMVKAIDEKIYT